MYNRYIPQSDGTYLRNRIPDAPRRPVQAWESPPPEPQPPPPCPQNSPPSPPPYRPRPPKLPGREPAKDSGVLTFLRRLLPRDFDSSDLLVVLLLLLISGDGCEEQNTALLTLALYLFL